MAKRYTDSEIADALLQCGTISKAAELLGLNRCRLGQRANSENVQRLLHSKRTELFSASCSKLVQASEEAINTLIQTMQDPKTSKGQRIRCAELILVNAFRGYELIDLENELRELKQEFEQTKGRGI